MGFGRFCRFNKYILRHHENGSGISYLTLGGEAGAAFEAAAFENEATRVGRIAFYKTVFNFALALVRLICSFRHFSIILYSFIYCQIFIILYRSFPL